MGTQWEYGFFVLSSSSLAPESPIGQDPLAQTSLCHPIPACPQTLTAWQGFLIGSCHSPLCPKLLQEPPQRSLRFCPASSLFSSSILCQQTKRYSEQETRLRPSCAQNSSGAFHLTPRAQARQAPDRRLPPLGPLPHLPPSAPARQPGGWSTEGCLRSCLRPLLLLYTACSSPQPSAGSGSHRLLLRRPLRETVAGLPRPQHPAPLPSASVPSGFSLIFSLSITLHIVVVDML